MAIEMMSTSSNTELQTHVKEPTQGNKPVLAEFLKATIPCTVSESPEFAGLKNVLLLSIPNSGERDGLCLLEGGKLYRFQLPGCTGLWLEGNRLFVSIMSPDSMTIQIYEPGHSVETIISCKLGDIHDVRIIDGKLYVVSTGTNEVIIVGMDGSLSKSWKMEGYGDSCHLNCLDLWDGRLVATAFGKFKTYRGYKGRTSGSGVLLDVKTKEILQEGYSAPHTPRRDEKGGIFVCDSRVGDVDYRFNGEKRKISFPGTFPRGLAFTKDLLYVGLSSLRHRKDLTFNNELARSGQLAIVDRNTFETLNVVPLPQAEIYDILILD